MVAAIPAFNEEVAIGSVVLKAKRHADEVIVIDDGSVDATSEIATMAGARVIKHPQNLGKGAAVRTALDYARSDSVEVLVLHDGDMQHDPSEIPAIVRPILEGRADFVIGTRWGKHNGMPLYRRMGKRALDYATSVASGSRILTDSQSGFRALSRRAMESLNPQGNGIGVESELLVQAVDKGLRLTEVPITSRYDVDGSTLNPAGHGMRVLGTIITAVSEKRPLFFFGVAGSVLLVIAAILAIRTLQLYYYARDFAIGYAFLFVLLTIVGILSVFVGIVLNAIRKMMRV